MKKTIVIADDNLDCGNNIKLFLNKYTNTLNVLGVVHTGESAINMVNKYNPNILILDLNMPIKNGLQVINEIEKNNKCDTKIIITSGEIPMLNKLNLIHSQRIIYTFIKPFSFSMLYSVISHSFKKDETIIIDEILHKFSFNFASQSYKYLLLVISKLLYKPFILNDVYKEIALEQNISPQRIKWGIEKLILSMARYTPNSILSKYVPYSKIPPPKVFISEIIKIVKQQLD